MGTRVLLKRVLTPVDALFSKQHDTPSDSLQSPALRDAVASITLYGMVVASNP